MAYDLRTVLKEVFDGHLHIDFDWYGWEGRARQALAAAPGALGDARIITAATLLPVADTATDKNVSDGVAGSNLEQEQ